jgi:hypothetical protein
MLMPFSCGTKGSDYSISDSLEPDLKTVYISLHCTTLPLLDLLYTWPAHVKATLYSIKPLLVPAGTNKSMLRRHGIQAVTRVMAYVANAVTL